MSITAKMIQELRQRTGVGMSKCKDALVRAEGSIEKAIEILRKEGMASSVKKEGRVAKDGFIGFSVSDQFISLVEINSETDFVAKNESFKNYLQSVADQVVNNKISSKEDLLNSKCLLDPSMSIDGYRNLLIQKFGENIQINRILLIDKKENGSYGIYKHMGGKLITIVEVLGSSSEDAIAKEIAMHVAAEAPEYLKKEDIPSDILEKEKEIARSQIKNKPANIIDKIVEGKTRAFFDSTCLVNQKYVKDPSMSVENFLNAYAAKSSKELSVGNFWYWKVGQ